MNHPITLSGDEYQELINALAVRDPVIAGLMRKQTEAQMQLQMMAETAAQQRAVPTQADTAAMFKRRTAAEKSEQLRAAAHSQADDAA